MATVVRPPCAELYYPMGVAVDVAGDLYIPPDMGNLRVREVVVTNKCAERHRDRLDFQHKSRNPGSDGDLHCNGDHHGLPNADGLGHVF